MKTHLWVVPIAAAGLILTSCATAASVETPVAQTVNAVEVDGEAPSATPSCTTQERCRAWLLFKAEDAASAAAKLEPYLTMGDNAYVVVRIDIVEGDYNLVVPVDTASEEDLKALVSTLMDLVNSDPLILRVTEHHPDPVTRSNSYVTQAEATPYPTDFPEAGRQVPNSPGANPWG